MKVMIADRRLQYNKPRSNDIWEFNHDVGEIVVPLPSLKPGEFADDEDGNARSLFGLRSGRKTTTAVIKDIPIYEAALIDQIQAWLQNRMPELSVNYRKMAFTLYDYTAAQIRSIPLGEFVECRDRRVTVREIKAMPSRRFA